MPFDNHGGSMGGSADDVNTLKHVDQDDVDRARLVAAYHSGSAAELSETLDMLGIGPDWPARWSGPVGLIRDLNTVVS